MYTSILQRIISAEFEKNVGTMQAKNERDGKSMFAMDLSFRLAHFFDFEEGWRRLNLRIFAYGNYVTVLVKELWDVRPKESKEDILGQDITGQTDWHLVVHHDCWDDVLSDIFRAYDERIVMLEMLFTEGWYTKHEITEKELKEIKELISARDHGDMSKQFNWKHCVLPIREPIKDKNNA
jgi:hypothetical protein